MPVLDQGPPPPPGVGTPTMASLAGQPEQDAGLQQQVLQKMMMIERMMDDVAALMPALQPVMGDLKQQFRARVGAIVLQGEQQPSQGGLMSAISSGASAPATS